MQDKDGSQEGMITMWPEEGAGEKQELGQPGGWTGTEAGGGNVGVPWEATALLYPGCSPVMKSTAMTAAVAWWSPPEHSACTDSSLQPPRRTAAFSPFYR